MSEIQAIIFDKNYWSLKQANSFIHLHDFKPIKKMHETKNYYRFRLEEPNKRYRYRTKEVFPGVKFIFRFHN